MLSYRTRCSKAALPAHGAPYLPTIPAQGDSLRQPGQPASGLLPLPFETRLTFSFFYRLFHYIGRDYGAVVAGKLGLAEWLFSATSRSLAGERDPFSHPFF